jgi:DNA-binding winged helix-turn-helix (wHTH) protein
MTATTSRGDERLILAVSQKVPEFVYSNVPEAISGVSSRTITAVPPSTVLLLMAHPGLCELEEAAEKADLTCLQLLDPRIPPTKIGEVVKDVLFLGATRNEILFRAARALAQRRGAALCPMPVIREDGLVWTDRFVPLSVTEVQIAQRLLVESGRVVSLSELNRVISRPLSDRRAIEAHLYRLRKKLQEIPVLELETVRQRGYRLNIKWPEPQELRPHDHDGDSASFCEGAGITKAVNQ